VGTEDQKPTELAAARFAEKFLCSQAIIMAFASRLDIEPGMAARVAASFGGGMARMGWTCGAASGALMVIGLKFGHESAQDEDKKNKTYERARKFLTEFEKRNGTVSCRELLGVDISTAAGLEKAEKEHLCDKVCPKFVRDAAEILENVLEDAD